MRFIRGTFLAAGWVSLCSRCRVNEGGGEKGRIARIYTILIKDQDGADF